MPSKNTVKFYDVDTYYHVYNRGVEKRKVFLDDEDYAVFLNLIKRSLNERPEMDDKGREYDWLAKDVELTAFCLMPNHFHLLLYQIEMLGITRLLRSVCSAYTTYFNKKYDRVGPLFQGVFKAVSVNNDAYILHIARYIHRNPSKYMQWEWSSLSYWLDKKHAAWVNPQRLNTMVPGQYIEYISDEVDYRAGVDYISSLIGDI